MTQVKSALQQVQSNLDVGGDTVTYDFIAKSHATAKLVAWKATRAPPLRVGLKGLTAQSSWAIIRIGLHFPRPRRAKSMRSARGWVSRLKVTKLDASRALSSPRKRMFIP